jgi:hypothetical protein
VLKNYTTYVVSLDVNVVLVEETADHVLYFIFDYSDMAIIQSFRLNERTIYFFLNEKYFRNHFNARISYSEATKFKFCSTLPTFLNDFSCGFNYSLHANIEILP